MRTNKNNEGRLLAVRDMRTGAIVEAFRVAGGRVRLATGENFGEARGPGEYEALQFLAPWEAGMPLARALAGMNEP